MAYSQDLRSRVLGFVKAHGNKSEAARRFSMHLTTVNRWCKQPADHQPQKPGPKDSRKFSRSKLLEAVNNQPDIRLKELALRFSVSISVVSQTLALLGVSRKKNTALRSSVHNQERH